MTREYILDYIVTPELTKEQTQEVCSHISQRITKSKGAIKNNFPPKKITLAYPIKKQEEGFWGRIEFLIAPEMISDVIEELNKNPKILRYVLAKRVKQRKQGRDSSKGALEKKLETKITDQEKKVDLEKIEKELDKLVG